MINHLIDDNTDLVYMYLISNKNIDKNYISLDINMNLIKKLTSNYKNINTRNMVYFYRKNKYYSYEKENDSQTIFRSILLKSELIPLTQDYSMYVNCYKEQKLPCYMFPSNKDIDDKVEMNIKDYKINNRISLVNRDNKSIYLYYKHSVNIDMDKNINDIKKFINYI
jgi:hypothetical protein